MNPIYIVLAFVIIGTVFFIYVQIEDRRTWNKGICKKNGLPWKHVDTCSNGFDCLYRAGEETVWLHWPYHE